MNTPQERHQAATAIAAMRSKPVGQPTRKSRALEIDHYNDAIALQRLESGEDVEMPSYNLTESNKNNYNRNSIAGATNSSNNYYLSRGGSKNGQ